MKPIANLSLAEEEVLHDVRQCIAMIKRTAGEQTTSLDDKIRLLERLRNESYEDLNQIQHEAMILRAAQDLQKKDLSGKPANWYWNPRQTGSSEEPDLRAEVAGNIYAVEITTSEKPNGSIDTRMKETLEKLSKMTGKKFYFVRTEAMERRAKTKVDKAGYQIEVRRV